MHYYYLYDKTQVPFHCAQHAHTHTHTHVKTTCVSLAHVYGRRRVREFLCADIYPLCARGVKRMLCIMIMIWRIVCARRMRRMLAAAHAVAM